MKEKEEIGKKIHLLKEKRKAVILAHNYQLGEVQDIADFTGDSLDLSQKASQTDARVIVFCGVHFMAESAKILGATITRFFPELVDTPLTHSWGGKLGVTFDLVPHIGRIDGIWYALGYGGHGVALSTYLGDQVAGLMAGTLERSPFAEIPHPTRFYYRGRAWFLPPASFLFRALDRFGL